MAPRADGDLLKYLGGATAENAAVGFAHRLTEISWIVKASGRRRAARRLGRGVGLTERRSKFRPKAICWFASLHGSARPTDVRVRVRVKSEAGP